MEWLVYLGVGAGAGILAGLLGVGGGVVIVPALVFAFTGLGYPPEHIMHLALGTSLASIMFTSISSFRAHHKRGAVLWSVVKAITPGIIVGTYAGSYVASMLSTGFLKGFFVAFLYWVSIQMLLNIKPKPKRALPGTPGMFAAGSTIGVVSSLVGIGGGSLSVPFMTLCNIPMHTAVGTSAAIGFPIAVAGAVGYLVNGLSAQGLPPMSIGYISLPALIGVAGMSVLTAPLGAKLAHALPVDKLKKIFALLLIITATRMLVSLL
ncbi:putative permease [Desulfocurvibacter africanus PCS]|uniref:Probable membrane transporter protein n=1 Tax=Desulfocurvibacter africanus PCS TaxID=1262666 RepID=M5PPA8_DESAF|nr:sulfite exporter TauE/SafE family protein [Desulfocurvibacter africanus]EMG35809.1 putative permease [Desulfocurvibacter africanus PCS]